MQGGILNFGFYQTEDWSILNEMESGLIDIITELQEELKEDQYVDLSLRFAVSPEEFLAEEAEPILNLLCKGISL